MQKREMYKCAKCGMVIEVLDTGCGIAPQCCGEEMKLLVAGSVDGAREKHVPVIEEQGDGILVKVGEIPHPMEEKHYIEWIELLADNQSLTCFLKPGDKPEAKFSFNGRVIKAREYCNLHGQWRSK